VTARPIVTLGEILVEIMADEVGHGFLSPLRLLGPFPSGAPAIFIDQVAKLGHPCGIISAVGDDDFGRVNLERLRRDGVDVRAVATDTERPTGSAFVRYRPDGERDFVFNVRHSASGHTALTPPARELLAGGGHFHVMGSSLFSEGLVRAVREAVEIVRGGGGTISFDPNIRKEMLASSGMREALGWVLRHCDIFLPSGPELTLLSEAKSDDAAAAELLALGIGAVVAKHGSDGATYYDRDTRLHVPAFPAEALDPTGAGDCFGATFVTCRLGGRTVQDSLRYAAASGAHAVTRRGPMEGTASLSELNAFIGPGNEGRRAGASA